MEQNLLGMLRRFFRSKNANVLPLSMAGDSDLRKEALIRHLLKESNTKNEAGWVAPLANTRFVVVDTETTGFNPNTDVLIAIGAVEMIGERIMPDAAFESLIRPEPARPIPPVVSKLTGIRDPDVAAAPKVADVLQRFFEFAGDAVLVMHHAGHDVRFLNAALWRTSRTHLTHRVLDTHDVAKWVWPRLNQYSLDDLLAACRIPVAGRHTAIGDAKLTAQLWSILLQEIRQKGVTTLGELYEAMILAKRV
ncbi:exonuclease domain-containing protein [Effusibacillus pohliae]|uniref:exonuclease domain-containing protein n=1 Tax=Effusibacillus pohliae TaxID=232270 RepID=UPI00035C40DB|nr:exonuclease domain-containing protein [Effusibacillus pohliae]